MIAKQINYMVDYLGESEQILVRDYIKSFLPDDVATPEDIADIAEAREEYRQGKTVKFEDIAW
jgi:hypothetical protein